MRYQHYYIIIFFLFIFFQQCTPSCQGILLQAGNYYEISSCVDECVNSNSVQNSTDLQIQNLISCCTPTCEEQIQFHKSKRVAIIVVSSFLGFFMLACCFYGCFFPSIEEKWVLFQQHKNYHIYTQSITSQQFDNIVFSFFKIFTESQRKNWIISFSLTKQSQQQMIWSKIRLKKLQNFQFELTIKGQDIFGYWVISGYFIHTENGPTCWGLKNYTSADNHTHVFDNLNDVIFQMFQQKNGNYEGTWNSRRKKDKKGSCWIRKRQNRKLRAESSIEHDENQSIYTIQSDKI